MLTRWHSVAGYILILLCLVGCAGGGSDRSPVEPATSDDSGITALREESSSGRGRMLLGFWDVALNTDTGEFEAVALRQAAFHTNIVTYIQDPAYLGISVLYENYTTGEFHLDVTLNHPFPNSELRGFDVRGIVFGNMSARDDPDLLSARDDPDLLWVGPNGFRLLNFDGWTRWWNPEEFTTSGLFGYTEGAFGAENFLAPATLNPYKYFANVLSARDPVVPPVNESNRGTFATDQGPATRRYELRFPIVGGFPDPKFQYAVDASWAAPTGGGDVPGIDDFPPEANCPEAFHILVDASDSTAFYDEEAGVDGGDLTLYIEVFDWGAADGGIDAQIERITVQSATLFDDVVDVQILSAPGSSNLSGIYSVTIPGVHPTALENQELLVTVISSGSHSYRPPMTGPDYPVGKPLAAYALIAVPISEHEYTPDILGEFGTSGEPNDVETIGKLCYVLDSVDGLLIVNVSDPEAPLILNTFALPDATALDVENGYAYVIDNLGNLQIVDVDPINAVSIVCSPWLPGSLTSIDVDGAYAYGGSANALFIIDIDPPESAYLLNTVPITAPGPITDVKAKDGFAYAAASDLEIFDVDPPGTAGSVKVVPVSSIAEQVDVSVTGYAFVGDSADQLVVVDVEPVASAAIVDTLSLTGRVSDVVCTEDVTCVTVSDEGLKVIGFSESTNTAYVNGELDITTGSEQLSIDGNMAYIDGEVTIVELWEEEEPDPTTGWARTWGGTTFDHGVGVAVDGSGNVYVTGTFYGTVDFDPGPGTYSYSENGNGDAFLSKFDCSGAFEWALTWGGGGGTETGFEVAADGSGNVYVTGYFQSTVDFDPGGGTDNHTSNGSWDVFLSKFDSSGAFQWALTWGGGSMDVSLGVAADGSGNAYVTGLFFGTVDFDPGGDTDDHTSNGDQDAFLSKFDSSGTFQWARTWGGIGSEIGYGVAADGSGNVYVAGVSGGASLRKFDSSGNFQWTRSWGDGGEAEYARGVATYESEYVYVTGSFNGTVDFDPGPGADYHVSISDDVFLSKFDSSGNFEWARTWGGAHFNYGMGVAADTSGNAYVMGIFGWTVDFDPGAGTDNHSSNGNLDVFLSKLDSSGAYQWARTWGGSGLDRGEGVALDSMGNVYTTGNFNGSVDFAPSGPPCNEDPDPHSADAGEDAFLVKYLPDGCWTP